MTEEELSTLQALKKDYLRIRNNGLLQSVTLNTIVGDFKISNKSIGNMVVDLLIKELSVAISEGLEK